MTQAARLNLRMQKELKLLLTDPSPGASFPFLSADSDISSLSTIDAQIEGPQGTVYAKGIFNIKIQIPERYPFQPPSVTFATPIYHPNIDNGGRICLDILNLPPKGAWQPSLNISTVLTSIGLLLSEPNPDDGLMPEASKEFKYNRKAFDQKARAMTEKYAGTGASGHNCRTWCIQTNADLSTMVEVQQSEKESKYEVNDFIPNHNKPSGINQKLLLKPSSSTHKRVSDGEASDVPNPLKFGLGNLETKRDRKELRDLPDKYSQKDEKQSKIGRKLSLESSVQCCERDGPDVKDGDPKQPHLPCNAQTLSMASSESTLLQGESLHELQIHQHRDCISTYDSKIMSSGNLYKVSQKIPWRSLDACQTNDGTNEKMLVTPAISPSHSHSNSSPGALTISSSVNNDALQTCQVSMEKSGNGSTDTKCKKVCSVRKKLSLGFKGSSGGQEKDDKENVLLMHKLSSSPKTQRKAGNDRKLHPSPLTQLQGSNEDNSRLFLRSGELPANKYRKQQSDQPQNGKLDGEIKQWGEETQVAESIIVLDSEDSEEESNGSIRSKLSLVRKCMGKRKAQA
ncbi:hypothetical protein GH714_024477 [Hevea brasiliensis]|uniref:E2 ubiquitin-conjugating enzyme n=1 Tax=Hevea brasiliensis TaxID=3981 RepID=A0A6A6LUV1_HEVBR|nr:hypothetical protein GH714_024278 [Hevea brasiliensis]KAF2303911.1 hypothetical protein GH714_024448 [Hevea brasiliensis]KAF2303913.1 hypothetical protein GH714_024477 [Hevea brasiliensis]